MAEGFEPYHVPQQSRRDKLRINSHHPPPQTGCAAETFQACASSLLPLYDPSLIPSDFNTCPADVHRHAYGLLRGDASVPCVKEEGANLMALLGGAAAASTQVFADPVLSTQLNPSSIHDVNGVPYAAFPSPAHCFPSYHHHHQDPNCTGQSLSLSLSSNHNPNLPLGLNLQKYDFRHSTTGFGHVEFSKSAVPLGPFTGYASVLKGSRLLRPAQQLLEELCDMGRDVYSDKNWVDSELLDSPSLDTFSGDGIVQENGDGGDHQTRKKSRLLIMLDEVCKRYKQYYQQLHAAVSAFESVAGLNRAAPFANLALKAMSKHFRCLKNTITDQLQSASKSHADEAHQRPANPGSGTHGPRPFRGAGFMDPPVWRPQRGLPEHAVTVLRSWLFEHFLHPYPTDTDKLMLAKQTGLSRNQVSNWFINARVRLWKPMVEEVHMLETRQQGRQSSEQSPNDPPATRPAPPEPRNPYPGDFPTKRMREDHIDAARRNHHEPVMSARGGNGGVSLTLGLHQNGMGLPEGYPINAARRFGLESQSREGYMGGFMGQTQHRQFEHIVHDFVG